MADWKLVTGEGGLREAELTQARNRKFNWRVGAPADISFDIDGNHDQALGLRDLITDAYVVWGTDTLFRGRLGAGQDTLDAQGYRLSYTAADYRAILEGARIVYDDDAVLDAWTATTEKLTANQQGFETDLTGWAVHANATIAHSSLQAKAGTDSMEVTAVAGGTASVRTPTGTSGFSITDGGYHFTEVWVYPTVACEGRVEFREYDAAGAQVGSTISAAKVLEANKWQRLSVTVMPGATADFGAELVHIDDLGAGDKFYVDESHVRVGGGDASDISWDLIQTTQARTGGNLGITRGTGQVTDIINEVIFEPGMKIGAAINMLAEQYDGFDWEIDADLAFNVYAPYRGIDNNVVLRYGDAVTRVDRSPDASEYGNAVRVTGDTALDVETYTAEDIATRPEGRWERDRGYTDIFSQEVLSQRAEWLLENSGSEALDPLALDETQVIIPSYVLTLKDGWWEGPTHLWLGDPVQLVIRKGRLDVNATYRVLEFIVSLDDNGKATLQVVLGAPRPDFGRRIIDVTRRLSTLERH